VIIDLLVVVTAQKVNAVNGLTGQEGGSYTAVQSCLAFSDF
jgi:hypothetical protein